MLIRWSAYAVGISCLLVAFLQVILAVLNPDSKKQLIFLLWFIIIDQSVNNTLLLLAHCTATAKVTNLFLFLSAGKKQAWLQKCKCSFFISRSAHTSKSQWSHWDNSRAQDCAAWDWHLCTAQLKSLLLFFSLWHTFLNTSKPFILITVKAEGLSLPEL